MYLEFETKTSYKYLKEVINSLEEPICILGGWAVFFHVNKNFEKSQGRPYLGSRDIDLGFHLDKDSSVVSMKKSALSRSLDVLQNKLNFKSVSFRLLKEVHTETEEEISKGQYVPSHFIFPMYIDVLVDFIPKDFNKVFGFNPADEPLLKFAFENKSYREELKEFNKKLWLPKPELLLATKINALSFRDKEHKKVKDICDIFSLLWYSGNDSRELASKVFKFISKSKIKQSIDLVNQEDLSKASVQLNHSPDEIRRVLELLKEL